jgi:hypothetical protein
VRRVSLSSPPLSLHLKKRKELIADQTLEDIATGYLRSDQRYRSDIGALLSAPARGFCSATSWRVFLVVTCCLVWLHVSAVRCRDTRLQRHSATI